MLDTVQTFWAGRELGPIELTMLRSFVRCGHPVHLYTYNKNSLGPRVPNGVVVKDAAEILPVSQVYFYPNNPSLSAFSNDFRFKLLHERGGVWADADVICVKPMTWLEGVDVAIASEYLPYAEGPCATTHFLKMPSNSAVTSRCIQVCAILRKEVEQGARAWGVGPDTVRQVVKELKLPLLDPEQTSVCSYDNFEQLTVPCNKLEEHITPNTCVIHLWHEMWRRGNINPQNVSSKSVFGRLRDTHERLVHSGKQAVLVTGAGGFIGRNLVSQLVALGRFHVTGVDLCDKPPEFDNNVEWFKYNVAEFNRFRRFDCIVHLAGAAGVRQSDNDPRKFVRDNVETTTAVFELAKACKAKVIYASSSSVYGAAPPPQDEAMPTAAVSFYALSKIMGENICEYYHRRWEVPSFALRFFTVYGKHGRANMAVRGFAEAIADGKPITVYGDGTQRRDYTNVRDTCAAIILCVDDVRGGYHTFNVGAGNDISVNELICSLEELVGRKAVVATHDRHPADVPATKACMQKFESYFKWKPEIRMQDGLAEFVAWLQSQQLPSAK
jgi:UDP-glucuronate 4-epimerase